MSKLALIISAFVFLGGSCSSPADTTTVIRPEARPSARESAEKNIDFSAVGRAYSFSGDIPEELAVEYVAAIDSINIYDPTLSGGDNLDKSLIFIRNFRANKFLTLSTVDISLKKETSINT